MQQRRPEEEPDAIGGLRQRARHCRTLAGSATDPRVQAMLRLLAHAYDQRAATDQWRHPYGQKPKARA